MLVVWILVFVASLGALVWSADRFVDAAERVGLRYGLPRFIVGVTIIAIGTSLPELVAALAAVWMGASEVAIGTAVGSNITNILLILGTAALLGRGIKVDYELVRVDLPFLFGSALLLTLFAYDGRVGAIEGLISLSGVAIYLTYAVRTADQPRTTVGSVAEEVIPDQPVTAATWTVLLASGILLQIGAHYTVRSVIEISAMTGLGTEIVAASAVALGTSLPEFMVTVRSARTGHPEIAVGNVIGSNVFNALGVVGIPALFGAISAPATIVGFALPAMVGVTILGFFVLQEREVTPWDGALLLVLYAGFNVELFRL